MTKYILTLALIAIFLFTGTDCKKDNGPIVPPDTTVTPLDTTSQNFTIGTLEFGDGFESSEFNDVWIFDENNIWVVGFLSSKDTIIDGQHVYNTNIIKWNGSKWNVQPYSGTSEGIFGIWASDSMNIYFANGLVVKYENGTYKEFDFSGMDFTGNRRVTKLWGSSNRNVYGVGPWGTVVHYDGTKWTQIEFDRQWYFYGFTGSKETGTAYAVATNSNFDCIIVQINTSTATIIYNTKNSVEKLTAYGIKLWNNSELILSNNQIWKFSINTKKEELINQLSSGYFLPRIAIAGDNDVYFYGSKFQEGEKMVHYNGKRFLEFSLPQRNSVIYGGAYAIKDLAIMVSSSDNKAIVTIIRRSQ
jgi:hypothetical protein